MQTNFWFMLYCCFCCFFSVSVPVSIPNINDFSPPFGFYAGHDLIILSKKTPPFEDQLYYQNVTRSYNYSTFYCIVLLITKLKLLINLSDLLALISGCTFPNTYFRSIISPHFNKYQKQTNKVTILD